MAFLTFIANCCRGGTRESATRLALLGGVFGFLAIWGICCFVQGYKAPGWGEIGLVGVLMGGKNVQGWTAANTALKNKAMDKDAPLNPQP